MRKDVYNCTASKNAIKSLCQKLMSTNVRTFLTIVDIRIAYSACIHSKMRRKTYIFQRNPDIHDEYSDRLRIYLRPTLQGSSLVRRHLIEVDKLERACLGCCLCVACIRPLLTSAIANPCSMSTHITALYKPAISAWYFLCPSGFALKMS